MLPSKYSNRNLFYSITVSKKTKIVRLCWIPFWKCTCVHQPRQTGLHWKKCKISSNALCMSPCPSELSSHIIRLQGCSDSPNLLTTFSSVFPLCSKCCHPLLKTATFSFQYHWIIEHSKSYIASCAQCLGWVGLYS